MFAEFFLTSIEKFIVALHQYHARTNSHVDSFNLKSQLLAVKASWVFVLTKRGMLLFEGKTAYHRPRRLTLKDIYQVNHCSWHLPFLTYLANHI